jgi:murein DD-endopeptidase MepM/ murein hydrolase activator NlpD
VLSPFDPPTGPPEPGHHHDLAEATAAVGAAQAALAAARADLAAARAAVLEARTQVEAARARGEQLRRDLAAAVQAEKRAERAIDRVRRRMEATRLDLGVVAGQAYRGDSYATLSVVLDASSPAEFAEGYAGVRALLRANDSALGALAADAADLADEHARLEAARELQQRFEREAEAAVAAKAAAEQVAREVQGHLAALVTRREEALVAAEEARRADQERYQTFLAQSSAVGASILDGAARLRAGAGVVEGTGDLAPPGDGPVTSSFGPRLHPILGYVKLHTGVDLGRGDGYVYAADAGTVVVAGSNPAYGIMTVVDHGSFGGQQLATLYAHQATLFVAEGDVVARGQRIGRIGSTGYATGPHLHFEVRLDGRAVNPWPWISRSGSRTR